MIQILNLLFNAAIFIEIMYIYTCGQDYVKIAVKRARRSFWIDKIIFMTIGLVAISSLIEKQEYAYTQTAMNFMVSVFFFRKCQSIYTYVKRVKESK